ncbi:MAG: hypothetical protein KDA22_13030 [Phycisphaerales bacterium]|nr:hypothetical protein [Phycisphaerales bacterium]
MPDLSRQVGPGPSAKPKLLIVRQPVRSVRPSDLPSPAPFRLAVVTVCVGGGIGAAWLLGHLGFRIGFAPAVGIPDLLAGPAEGLSGGVRQLLGSAALVFRAGLVQPMLLLAGFLAIAAPAAGLAATRPLRPGGPRPSAAAVALSTIAAVAAIAIGALLIVWTAVPVRLDALATMPTRSTDAADWIAGVRMTAGADTLASTAAVVWTVLVFRLAVPRWLRTLAATTMVAASIVTVLAWAASSAIAVEIARPRPLVDLGAGRGGGLVLGYTPGHAVLLRRSGDRLVVDLRPDDETMRVTGRASAAALLEAPSDSGLETVAP